MSLKTDLQILVWENGYPSLADFVFKKIRLEGMTFVDLTNELREKYRVGRSYSAVYAVLRKYAPNGYDRRFRFDHQKEQLAKRKGFKSFQAMLMDFKRRNLNYREIANELGIKSPINVKRLETRYNITLSSDENCRKAGFINQAKFREWNKQAKKLGYSGIEEALSSMVEDGKTNKEIAEVFHKTPQCIWRRITQLMKAKRKKLILRRRK